MNERDLAVIPHHIPNNHSSLLIRPRFISPSQLNAQDRENAQGLCGLEGKVRLVQMLPCL